MSRGTNQLAPMRANDRSLELSPVKSTTYNWHLDLSDVQSHDTETILVQFSQGWSCTSTYICYTACTLLEIHNMSGPKGAGGIQLTAVPKVTK